jgi:hypothetical protein
LLLWVENGDPSICLGAVGIYTAANGDQKSVTVRRGGMEGMAGSASDNS